MPRNSPDHKVRLYGRFHGTHSLAQVAEGFSEAFAEAFRYDLDYWSNTLDEVAHAPGGVDAKHAIFLGPLNQLSMVATRGRHPNVHVMVAPNSDKIGQPLLEVLEAHATHYLVPSEWARQILCVYTDKPVTVVRHGVLSSFRPTGAQRYREFSVLHLSSTMGERKGTSILIEAWKLANLPNSKLFLSVPGESVVTTMDAISDAGVANVELTRRLDYDPDDMRALYASVHYVCQPSRGEGFGLVPLEARACGTPVIATTCTGHSEHMFGPGVVAVWTGDSAPIDDFPGAMAPSLSVDDLAAALVRAYEEQNEKIAEAVTYAETIRNMWSWKNQLKEFRNGLRRN